MNCSKDLIEAYFDEELEAAGKAMVEQHLAACEDCSAAYVRLQTLRERIQAGVPYYHAPAALEQSIRRELRQTGLAEAVPARVAPWRWVALAASVLLAVSVLWNLYQWRHVAPDDQITQEIVAGHIRSLVGTHLIDVASSDRHTVKPWFAGKLDFAPEVRDLEAQGFPLVGGRVDYMAGRRVAALVYHRRQHVINLFIWPPDARQVETHTAHNGYNVVHWSSGSLVFWAVSDVSVAELETLRGLYR